MTTIKATCPGCGEIDLTAGDILLRIANSHGLNSYGFSCPSCGDFVEKPADDRIVRLLLSGGVMPMLMEIPAEAMETHYGPAFTHDDLLTFHEMLQSENWFEDLQQVRHRPDTRRTS